MPPNTATLRVGPYLLSLLLVLVAAFGLVFLPGQRHTPKLGLDLEGGAQVTLQAQMPNGKAPNPSAMKVARQILENRVNAKGVSAAQVYQQGNNQIVIAVPGANSQQVAKVGQAAKLNFRPVIFPAVPNAPATATTSAPASAGTTGPSGTATSGTATSGTATSGTATTAPASTGFATTAATTSTPGTPAAKASTSANGLLDANRAQAAAPTTVAPKTAAAKTTPAKTAAAATTPAKTTTPTPTPPATATAAAKLSADPFTKLGFALPTSEAAFDALTVAQQTALQTALSNFDCSTRPVDVATKPLATCDNSTPPTAKYLLGPVIVPGTEVSSADAVAPSASGNTSFWTVSINLKSKGQAAWADFTGKHHSDASNQGGAASCSSTTVPCADYVAFTLDGAVIGGPPQTQSTINGATQVSGNFSEAYAKDLANDLKYGALPLNFTQLTQQDVSPTLGSSQLKAGLFAGGIGLLLVVIYSFLYYRGLGFVTVASLLVSGALTYATLVILGREIGFTLTLAGIAGFIVAVGITADSFVVLFERLKDEVHSGRSLRVAVPRAWTRARRTILSADTVSFIAAAVLYYFTVGDVRGFAFTLGLSTLLDLVVVFLFTHPLVSLLSRSRAFGSPGFTGLNSVRVGGIAASPKVPARAANLRRARAGGGATALGGGAVALLGREDESDGLDLDNFDPDDLDPDDLDPDDVDSAGGGPHVVGGATAAPVAREPELDSGAPRRSRVVPRSTPPAEIGADAAERAAARRGRAVRAPKPVVQEPAEDDLVEQELVDDDRADQDLAVDEVDRETSAASADEVSGTEVSEPVEFPVPAREGTSTATERAGARRRRGRSQPPAAATPATAPAATAVEAETVTESEPVTESEAVVGTSGPGTAVPAADVAAEAPAAMATAAERAAARRARIRSRAGSPNDTDDEDES